MKLQVYFLYRTDEHLSTDSKELLFIGTFPIALKRQGSLMLQILRLMNLDIKSKANSTM